MPGRSVQVFPWDSLRGPRLQWWGLTVLAPHVGRLFWPGDQHIAFEAEHNNRAEWTIEDVAVVYSQDVRMIAKVPSVDPGSRGGRALW